MSKYLCLLFMIFCVSGGWTQRVGNPDDGAQISRPCPTLDQNCIRRFFARHSNCKKVYGPVPDPYFRPKMKFFLPRVNITVTIFDETINGLNGKINDFYVNNSTDKVVLVIEFLNVNITSNSTYFRFHRRAKEPVVTRAFANIIYNSTIMTAVIPNRYHLDLQKAEITAFSNDAFPSLIISPSAAISTDPTIPLAFAAVAANVPVNNQEFFLTEAPFYVSTFIQYNICDFGLKVL